MVDIHVSIKGINEVEEVNWLACMASVIKKLEIWPHTPSREIAVVNPAKKTNPNRRMYFHAANLVGREREDELRLACLCVVKVAVYICSTVDPLGEILDAWCCESEWYK